MERQSVELQPMAHYAKTIGLCLLLVAGLTATARAHSLKDIESQLGSREKYFQAIDREAPDFTLKNADGRVVRLADFKGKVVVLHFIYTNCPDVCPLHAERIAEIQQMINTTPMRDQVQFISITTDPENDTGNVLRAYGLAHGLEQTNWMFLTSGPERETETRTLAERFGHKFTKTKDGYQIHGVVTHVIDREGRRRANFHGLKFNPTNLVLYVNALVNDVHTSQGKDTDISQRQFIPHLWDKFREWLRHVWTNVTI